MIRGQTTMQLRDYATIKTTFLQPPPRIYKATKKNENVFLNLNFRPRYIKTESGSYMINILIGV